MTMGTNRRKRRRPSGDREAHAPRAAETDPAKPWEGPPPPEVLALLERFPMPTRNELAMRHAMLLGVALIALYGVLALGWSASAIAVFFLAEVATIWLLNWLTLALLPVALRDEDRRVVRAWIWFACVALAMLGVWLAVEGRPGWDTLRDGAAARLRAAWEWLGAQGLRWSIAGVVLVHVFDLAFDIAHWRRRGGEFRYWSGITFLFRLWFCLSIGLFVAFFGWLTTQAMERRTAAAFVLWLVFVLSDLFATWMPIWLRRKAERHGAV
jgi:hypothetical protein